MDISEQISDILLEYGKIGKEPTYLEEQCIKAIASVGNAYRSNKIISYKDFFESILRSLQFYGIIGTTPDTSDNKCIAKLVAVLSENELGGR